MYNINTIFFKSEQNNKIRYEKSLNDSNVYLSF